MDNEVSTSHDASWERKGWCLRVSGRKWEETGIRGGGRHEDNSPGVPECLSAQQSSAVTPGREESEECCSLYGNEQVTWCVLGGGEVLNRKDRPRPSWTLTRGTTGTLFIQRRGSEEQNPERERTPTLERSRHPTGDKNKPVPGGKHTD
ncbi:unnamed protein product [Boreogadus saida]